ASASAKAGGNSMPRGAGGGRSERDPDPLRRDTSAEAVRMKPSMDFVEQFREEIQFFGLVPPAQVIADGKIHRFAPNGRPSDRAGWYILFGDGIPAGSFGDWRRGLNQSWHADLGRK